MEVLEIELRAILRSLIRSVAPISRLRLTSDQHGSATALLMSLSNP